MGRNSNLQHTEYYELTTKRMFARWGRRPFSNTIFLNSKERGIRNTDQVLELIEPSNNAILPWRRRELVGEADVTRITFRPRDEILGQNAPLIARSHYATMRDVEPLFTFALQLLVVRHSRVHRFGSAGASD
jgi:hypothetical protein